MNSPLTPTSEEAMNQPAPLACSSFVPRVVANRSTIPAGIPYYATLYRAMASMLVSVSA